MFTRIYNGMYHYYLPTLYIIIDTWCRRQYSIKIMIYDIAEMTLSSAKFDCLNFKIELDVTGKVI